MANIYKISQELMHFANWIGCDGGVLTTGKRNLETEAVINSRRKNIKEINRYIQADTPLPDHLKKLFQKAIQSDDLNSGFGLKPGGWQKEDAMRMRNFGIFLEVQYSELPKHTSMNRDDEIPDLAFAMAGEKYSLSAGRARDVYYEIIDFMEEAGYERLTQFDQFEEPLYE
jgi:hypothetical protein